jgi:hypothetical protein
METKLSKSKFGILYLKEKYKLDLKLVLNDLISTEKLTECFPLVDELIQLSHQNEKSTQSIEQASDAILEKCLSHLHLRLSNEGELLFKQNVNGQVASPVEQQPVDTDILLKYFRLCANVCSERMKFVLFKFYLYLFVKLTKYEFKPEDRHLPNDLVLLVEQGAETYETFGVFKESNCEFIVSLLGLLAEMFVQSSSSLLLTTQNSKLVEFLIDCSLCVLYESEESSSNNTLTRLSVNTLAKLALSVDAIRRLVLDKCFTRFQQNNTSVESSALNSNVSSSNECKKRLESFVQDTNVNLLTALADCICRVGDTEFMSKAEYWQIVQTALSHTNSLSRKRALYLLKRTTDLAQVSHIRITSEYFETYTRPDKQTGIDVHLYDSSASHWNDFFLCIELLEETSVHIIKPSLPRVEALIDAVKSFQFHYSWLFVLFNRAFFHDSKFVVKWAMSTFFQADLHKLFDSLADRHSISTISFNIINNFNNFIFGNIMLILQKSFIYTK